MGLARFCISMFFRTFFILNADFYLYMDLNEFTEDSGAVI